jgi:hypothetical protein
VTLVFAMPVRASEPGAGARTRLTKTQGVVTLVFAMPVCASEPGAGARTRLTKTKGVVTLVFAMPGCDSEPGAGARTRLTKTRNAALLRVASPLSSAQGMPGGHLGAALKSAPKIGNFSSRLGKFLRTPWAARAAIFALKNLRGDRPRNRSQRALAI